MSQSPKDKEPTPKYKIFVSGKVTLDTIALPNEQLARDVLGGPGAHCKYFKDLGGPVLSCHKLRLEHVCTKDHRAPKRSRLFLTTGTIFLMK